MDSSPQRRPARVSACQRCRRRKQKCDLKHPSCSNCESASVACLTYISSKRADLPRTYISDLESEVERLARENRELQILLRSREANEQHSPYTSASTSTQELGSRLTQDSETPGPHLQDFVTSVCSVVVESTGLPRFLGPSSGITLATMVMASVRPDALTRTRRDSVQRPDTARSQTSVAAAESCLPPRHAADHLVEVYFQYRTPHLPIVQRAQVAKVLDSAYLHSNCGQIADRDAQRDVFTTYMILAIALCNVPNPSGGTNRVSQTQFVSMCPWQGSLWHLIGIAMRLSVDMGLHWETEDHLLNTDSDLLYECRRLWYCAYQFDRVLGITLG
ncbi:unnamed protein product [Zymoseptoria tritici ST99CH_1A5]|uniref:Zn(2)-C6 fungal-type domain-containing protein n=1 Tax=Zymoseptoria tritici ST99CH_1A5 TaxID=1276529 RepID=A0A1Y6L4C0_ZYMTR|nr:unnamed protein product [Zymoseptoria tritici ST99CH_1A5]